MSDSVRRLRCLLIAELANPEWVSIPLEGWSHTRAIAELADVHLVTHIRNRPAILRASLKEGEAFTALDSTPVEKPLNRVADLLRGDTGVGQTTATAFSAFPYYYFEHLAWQRFGDQIRHGAYDVVHRVTPLSPTIPSILARRCAQAGVPFVLGPLNGGLPWPAGFGGARRREKEWLSYVRDLYKLMPGYRATREYAAAIVVGSKATWSQVPERYTSKTVYIPENAIDPDRFTRRRETRARLPLRIAFVGRLVPYKGADILLEAAAPFVKGGQVSVDIIGDGPELSRLQTFARQAGIDSGVCFAGWVPHQQLQDRLVQSHIFGFPSIREFGGAVVLEAMALGLVPLVVDYGGPGELVSPASGFAIPLGRREELIARIHSVLERVVADPAVLEDLGQRARERAFGNFTWQVKARQCVEVYRWVLGHAPDKPDFGMPLPDAAKPQYDARSAGQQSRDSLLRSNQFASINLSQSLG